MIPDVKCLCRKRNVFPGVKCFSSRGKIVRRQNSTRNSQETNVCPVGKMFSRKSLERSEMSYREVKLLPRRKTFLKKGNVFPEDK